VEIRISISDAAIYGPHRPCLDGF